jgi:hypothetical protein
VGPPTQKQNNDAEKELLRLINLKTQLKKIKAMKKQSENRFNPLSDEHVKTLTSVVKETVATGFSKPKSFTTIDLWNIQRKNRTMMQRRSFV